MLKWVVLFCFINTISGLHSQDIQSPYHTKKIIYSNNSIQIDSVAINESFFKLLDAKGQAIDTSFYKVNFNAAQLHFKKNFSSKDTIVIRYLKFPDFLTKEYTIYNKNRVVENGNGLERLYKVTDDNLNKFTPFDGLTTSGNISRGITIGNGQNTSVNSNLDLQITGKLFDKVNLRASIQDSNIPLQEGGYSQKLDEFDQIFIELYGNKWSVRAGDLFLENRQASFLNFNKKVQGLLTHITLGKENKKTDIYASGAIVRGQYAKSSFIGQEGNQGPYKLKGANGELYVLVISGSEQVYVNGILLKRGENNHYTIDYNAGEIIFTSLFPITSEMRIVIEYQYSDRNYTRLVTYGGAKHEQNKWSLSGYVYSENDVKNQSLQQNLTTEQAQLLAQAGDNPEAMNTTAAQPEVFSENKILYKKINVGGATVFEYSTNPLDVLFLVKFTYVGENKGNYKVANANANGKVFVYHPPINTVLQGNYEPIIKLVAPTKIQITTLLGNFNPSEKTALNFEFGLSNKDLNLFSSLDDNNNHGIVTKINAKQRLLSKKWLLDAVGSYQIVQKNFSTIERLFSVEFNRDWNLNNPAGNQNFITAGVLFSLPNQSNWSYHFENLNFSENFNGIRQVINGSYTTNKWNFVTTSSYLKSNGSLSTSKFFRTQNQTKYHFKKNWVGGSFKLEDNQEKLKPTNEFTLQSQRFSEYGAFIGRGDSTRVYVEIGHLNRVNDSLQMGVLKRVNHSQSYYTKAKLLQTDLSDLSLFINYRNLTFKDPTREKETSLNSRVLYNDRFFGNLIQSNTAYENSSGTIPQQEFNFVAVEPGKGIYTWKDYNNNGIQEIQEFEIAPFPDQATFIKVFLPNQIYVKTHLNKFSQSIAINPSHWQNEKGLKKMLSFFNNQSSFLIERKIKKEGQSFNLNPFTTTSQNLLGLNASFRNSLFYHKGKQKHSVIYSFLTNQTKIFLSAGEQEAKNSTHQLQYIHLIKKYWLVNLTQNTSTISSNSQNYPSRNYDIKGFQIESKLSYLFNNNTSLGVFYERQNKKNEVGETVQLSQNKLGTSFNYSSDKKLTINGAFNWIDNQYSGNEFSPVAFQMLDGLQVGKNATWSLLLQKNLTSYLDININYIGRKSELLKTIHTGSIQLRAFF